MAKISKKKKVVATATAALVAVSLAIGGSVLVPKKSVQNVVPPIEQVAIIEQTPVPSATPKPLPSKTPKATPKPTKAPAVEVKVTPTPAPAPLTTLELFGISGKTIVEGTYAIKKVDRNKSELSIDIPKSLNADLYELYLNGQYVDKQLLPNGRILAPPLIFTVPELIELRIFKLQEVIAVGKLKDGKLTIAVKDGVISE